jgi:hypothetical protein
MSADPASLARLAELETQLAAERHKNRGLSAEVSRLRTTVERLVRGACREEGGTANPCSARVAASFELPMNADDVVLRLSALPPCPPPLSVTGIVCRGRRRACGEQGVSCRASMCVDFDP